MPNRPYPLAKASLGSSAMSSSSVASSVPSSSVSASPTGTGRASLGDRSADSVASEAEFSSAGKSAAGRLAVVRSLHKGTSMRNLSCRREGKVMDVTSVRQLSNAYLPGCASGARTLLSSVFVTDTNSTKGAALRKHSSAALDTPRGGHLSQHVAPLEGSFFKTHDRRWEPDNLHRRLCQQFLHAGWPERANLGVAFPAVSLELPDGVSICHAGTHYLAGLLRVKVEQVQPKTSKSETVGRKQRMSSSSSATFSYWARFVCIAYSVPAIVTKSRLTSYWSWSGGMVVAVGGSPSVFARVAWAKQLR